MPRTNKKRALHATKLKTLFGSKKSLAVPAPAPVMCKLTRQEVSVLFARELGYRTSQSNIHHIF